jgi:hypothetical protein
MPVEFVVLSEHSLVLSKAWGSVTGGDFHAQARELAAHPQFDRTFKQLTDLREVATPDVTADDIRKLAALNPFEQSARRVAIANSDVAFGMSRMYQMLVESQGGLLREEAMRIFRELDDGLRWLGLEGSREAIAARLSAMRNGA